MKNMMLAVLALSTAMTFAASVTASTAAFAEDAPAAAAPAPEKKGPSLDERKQKILQRIDERMAEAQKRKNCVEAASTPEALKSCRPEKHDGHGPGPCGGDKKGKE